MQPKQWNRGGGQQTVSVGVRSILSPMLLPLLRIERWVRQAALGREVVPEVNWMLMISSGDKDRSALEVLPSACDRTSLKLSRGFRFEASTRPSEFSTRMTCFRDGIESDCSFRL